MATRGLAAAFPGTVQRGAPLAPEGEVQLGQGKGRGREHGGHKGRRASDTGGGGAVSVRRITKTAMTKETESKSAPSSPKLTKYSPSEKGS